MKKICILLLLVIAGCSSQEPRIISQSPYITHTLKYLGQEENIVGVSRYDFLDRPRTGGILDPEEKAIAELDPDYIFTSDWTAPEVLRKVTPDGAKAVVLQGFHNMAEIEENIRAIIRLLHLPDGEEKATEFSIAWRGSAEKVGGKGKRALILSSCKGEPFSFGVNTYLFDLFSVAGFNLVETHPSIRHVNASGDMKSVDELLRRTEPEIVFVLQDNDHGCSIDIAEGNYKVVLLDGEHFIYPAPVLLEGIADLERIFPGAGNDNEEKL